MTEFFRVSDENAAQLSRFAAAIVKEHYDPIIGAEQNDYMIKKFQSEGALKEQMKNGCRYYFAVKDNMKAGFFGFYPRDGKMYISKLYIDKGFRRQHIACDCLDFIAEQAKAEGTDRLFLNVNRYNDGSIAFYEKMGFVKMYTEDNDIGNGYFMNDFVMERGY